MLFAVIIGDSPGEPGDSSCSGRERQRFLDSLKQIGRLALEATYGESGSLMVLRAESTNDALALLYDDPRVLVSSRVRIRPLEVNFVADSLLGSDRRRYGDPPAAPTTQSRKKKAGIRIVGDRKKDRST